MSLTELADIATSSTGDAQRSAEGLTASNDRDLVRALLISAANLGSLLISGLHLGNWSEQKRANQVITCIRKPEQSE